MHKRFFKNEQNLCFPFWKTPKFFYEKKIEIAKTGIVLFNFLKIYFWIMCGWMSHDRLYTNLGNKSNFTNVFIGIKV